MDWGTGRHPSPRALPVAPRARRSRRPQLFFANRPCGFTQQWAHQLHPALAVWGLGGCAERLKAARRCMHVFCRVKQSKIDAEVPKTWCTSGLTTSRQFGTCRRRDGSPGALKRQAGRGDACFFKNTTRTIERSDVSVSFVSSTAARVVLGQNTHPTRPLSFPSIGSQGWLWLLASTQKRHRRAGRSVSNRWRNHRLPRCISLL